ncbi:MAG: hypothetical protein Q4G59_07655, partial [Planctomycetia bacterium]|nr:hypothetical protein [Planctomycetia bacterium]
MKKRIALSFILCCTLIMSITALIQQTYAKGIRDKLEGLVFEAEEWSTPKDGWLKDQTKPDKWKLWTTERNAWNARSGGQSLRSPDVMEDRKTPEEGAPVLHTKITGIPNGLYRVYCNNTVRPLAFSFDKGTTWIKGRNQGEECFGVFDIQDGTFEVWVDDRYAAEKPEKRGGSYYDYLRFVPGDHPTISHLKSFTLPNGDTQLSWISSEPTMAAVVKYNQAGQTEVTEVSEEESGLRNHCVVLSGLQQGKKYTATVPTSLNWANTGKFEKIDFIAGQRPVSGPTKKVRVRLRIDEPTDTARKAWPVTSGVPFAKGVLANTNDVCLFDAQEKRVPAQFESYSTWPDGSIKWLVCDFRADTQSKKPSFYYLQTDHNVGISKTPVKHDCDGYLAFLKKLSSKIILADGTALISQGGEYRSESMGDVRATYKGQGTYRDKNGQEKFRWGSQVSFFGNDFVQIRWTIGNDQLEEQMTLIRSATVYLNQPQGKQLVLSDGKKMQLPVSIILLDEKNIVCQVDNQKSDVKTFDGFIQTTEGSWTIAHCREAWPKGVSADANRIEFSILPALEPNYMPEEAKKSVGYLIRYYWLKDGCYLFKRGMEIRQDFWYSKTAAGTPQQKANWSSNSLFAVA